MAKPQVSLTIPCYNEGPFIFKSIERISKVMGSTGLEYEIILFDDCSRDSTLENLKKIASENKRVKVFSHEKNVGRGGTVRDAILKAQAPIVGFLDVDLEGSPKHIPEFIKAIQDGFDVVNGIRHSKMGLRHYHRVILGKGYNFFERAMLGIKVRDSQAGYKFFNKAKIMPILEECENEYWFWDTEVMLLSELRGLKIKEIPVQFKKNPESKSTARLLSNTLDYVKEVFALRKRLKKKGLL